MDDLQADWFALWFGFLFFLPFLVIAFFWFFAVFLFFFFFFGWVLGGSPTLHVGGISRERFRQFF